jgi:hypothetical protein
MIYGEFPLKDDLLLKSIGNKFSALLNSDLSFLLNSDYSGNKVQYRKLSLSFLFPKIF